MVRGKRWGSRH